MDRENPSSTRLSSNVQLDSKPEFFALVIGINNYPKVKKLHGAVADAEAISKFLREEMKIPKDQIIEIYNETATRASVIEGFRHLKNDERIKKEDAILIFYAGHGSEIAAPSGWETDGRKIQALVPYDTKMQDKTGKVVEVLPDRTIGSLIEQIVDKKGDNITVILDCCHSSGVTRADGEGLGYNSRWVESKDLPSLSPDTDANIIQSRAMTIPPGFAHSGTRSHVLLAACGAEESAWERDGRGAFTLAILSILHTACRDTLTYTELMSKLPKMSLQNPHCIGEHSTRKLFDNRLAGGSLDTVKVKTVDGQLQLQAGLVHGVTKGAKFAIYEHHYHHLETNRLATLEVLTSSDFNSNLGPVDVLSKPLDLAYARQLSFGESQTFKVYVSSALNEALKKDIDWQTKFLARNSELVACPTSDPEQADLILDIYQPGRVSFVTGNRTSKQHGISKLPYTTPVDAKRILTALEAAAAWHLHLTRTNPLWPVEDTLRFEFFRVKEDKKVWNEEEKHPLVRDRNNLITNGVVELEANPQHYYGIKIFNGTPFNLHPYLFYFDCNDLAIDRYYLGAVSGAESMDYDLRSDGSLSLGYGAVGQVPFAYQLDPDREFDVGVLKLFVTTTPVDFGLLVQSSPFEPDGRDERGPVPRKIIEESLAKKASWATKQIVIVQRKMRAESTDI